MTKKPKEEHHLVVQVELADLVVISQAALRWREEQLALCRAKGFERSMKEHDEFLKLGTPLAGAFARLGKIMSESVGAGAVSIPEITEAVHASMRSDHDKMAGEVEAMVGRLRPMKDQLPPELRQLLDMHDEIIGDGKPKGGRE